MDKFLERQKLPKPTQEEIDYLNSPISTKAIECVVKILKENILGSDGFTGEFYQTFKNNINPTVHRFFQKTEKQGILST